MNVGNCPRCGRIFQKGLSKICPDCRAEEEHMYDVVAAYLRDNPKSTVEKVSEETGVPKERILQFLREGRLQAAEWLQLEYPCSRCGATILSGKYCEKCSSDLQASFQTAAREIAPAREKDAGGSGYHIKQRPTTRRP